MYIDEFIPDHEQAIYDEIIALHGQEGLDLAASLPLSQALSDD